MGKIPALVHNDVVITEAAAICMHLADAFPQAGLAPRIGEANRGTYLRWFFFAASSIEPAMFAKSPPSACCTLLPSGYGTAKDTFATLEKVVEQGFILGNKFSAADVYIASCLAWGISTGTIEPIPAFKLDQPMLR